MKKSLVEAIANLEEDKALEIVSNLLTNGIDPQEIISSCNLGVKKVGEKYKFGIYYLSDLIMSSEILIGVTKLLEPHIKINKVTHTEVDIVIGTIHGDIHDIGKNILIFILRSAGFKIHDLGVNVPQENFLRALEQTGSSILCVSVLLSSCFNEVKKLNILLQESGLREKVKFIIGGAPVNEALKDYVGADYYSNDAIKSLEIFHNLAQEL
jgi:methanogenic corrinoid protein MtbC1